MQKNKKEPNSAPVQTDQIFFADSKLNSGFNQNEKAQIQPKVENAETRNQKSPENLKLAKVALKMTTEDQILIENREVSDSLERTDSKLLDLETEQAWDFQFSQVLVGTERFLVTNQSKIVTNIIEED